MPHCVIAPCHCASTSSTATSAGKRQRRHARRDRRPETGEVVAADRVDARIDHARAQPLQLVAECGLVRRAGRTLDEDPNDGVRAHVGRQGIERGEVHRVGKLERGGDHLLLAAEALDQRGRREAHRLADIGKAEFTRRLGKDDGHRRFEQRLVGELLPARHCL
jgi:hypothetical protein